MLDITRIITYIKRNNYPLYLEILQNDYIRQYYIKNYS